MELSKFTANCAKSAQFAHCHCKSHEIRAICINFLRFSVPTSKIAKLVAIHALGKLRKFRWPFSDSDHGKWTSQNLQQIAQNLLNLPTVTINHAKFTQFVSISQGSLYPWVELSNFVIFVYLCNFVDFPF